MTAPIVAFVNQKGGVGKTTTVLGIASSAASRGQRVLVVDTDPQGNATAALGVDPTGEFDLNDLIDANTDNRNAIREVVLPSAWPGHVELLAASLDLAKRDVDTTPMLEFRLRKAIRLIADDYDIILIDCSPNLGKLVMSALIAATQAIVVTEPSAPALSGVLNLRETISAVQEYGNHELVVTGIAVNRETRTNESKYRVAELEEAFGSEILEPHIPDRAVIAQALGAQQPIHSYLSKARDASSAYDDLLASKFREVAVGR